jgi:hypothetical protein
MATLTATPKDLTAAIAALKGKDRVKIGNNTELRLEVTPKGRSVVATLHGHRIVRYEIDGVYASWAGYTTSTTRDRLNQLAPARFNIAGRLPHIDGEEVLSLEWVKLTY